MSSTLLYTATADMTALKAALSQIGERWTTLTMHPDTYQKIQQAARRGWYLRVARETAVTKRGYRLAVGRY